MASEAGPPMTLRFCLPVSWTIHSGKIQASCSMRTLKHHSGEELGGECLRPPAGSHVKAPSWKLILSVSEVLDD